MNRSFHGRYVIDRRWWAPVVVEVWDNEAWSPTEKWPKPRAVRMGIYVTQKQAARRVAELLDIDAARGMR